MTCRPLALLLTFALALLAIGRGVAAQDGTRSDASRLGAASTVGTAGDPAPGSCCSGGKNGAPAVCTCGKVAGSSCCCAKRRAAGAAACSASCKCGEESNGTAAPELRIKPHLYFAALHTRAIVAEPEAWLLAHEASAYDSPAFRIDPPPPRRGRIADNG